MFSLHDDIEPLHEIRRTPLGKRVVAYALAFDRSEQLRFLILRHFLTRTAYVLDDVEPDVLARKLRDWPSHIWWREKTVAYADFLDRLLTRLRGGGPLIVTDITDAPVAIDDIRCEWLQAPQLRKTVAQLRQVLERAITGFSVQWIATALMRPTGFFGPIPVLVGRAGTRADVLCELTSISDEAYGATCGMLQRHAVPLYTQLSQLGGTAWRFLLTDRQLTQLALQRMGKRVDLADFLEDEAAVRQQGTHAPWEQRESGVWVPSA